MNTDRAVTEAAAEHASGKVNLETVATDDEMWGDNHCHNNFIVHLLALCLTTIVMRRISHTINIGEVILCKVNFDYSKNVGGYSQSNYITFSPAVTTVKKALTCKTLGVVYVMNKNA